MTTSVIISAIIVSLSLYYAGVLVVSDIMAYFYNTSLGFAS